MAEPNRNVPKPQGLAALFDILASDSSDTDQDINSTDIHTTIDNVFANGVGDAISQALDDNVQVNDVNVKGLFTSITSAFVKSMSADNEPSVNKS